MDTVEGIGDRLRTAAFAELQAREAFFWAAANYQDRAEPALISAWQMLAQAEDKHLSWLMARMTELSQPVGGRRVSEELWHSLVRTQLPEQFAWFMASAEERGRKAGLRFAQGMRILDPISAAIFGKIAEEEIEHIALARRFFPAGIERHTVHLSRYATSAIVSPTALIDPTLH